MTIFGLIEKWLYNFRDLLWEYPSDLFINPSSPFQKGNRLYLKIRPLSHFVAMLLIGVLLIALTMQDVRAVFNINSKVFIEGTIVGTDEKGDLQQLHRINPLINTDVQLERDLSELIYESLIKVDQSGKVQSVLADYIVIKEAEKYQFKLKDNRYWQDGVRITTQDVAATFDLLKELESDPKTSTIYSRAASKIELKIIDDLSFEFNLNAVVPAFFEAISFKILPKHAINDLNRFNIISLDPLINRQPLGSGPFRLESAKYDEIKLVSNKYYPQSTKVDEVRFKLFPDEATAVDAIRGGEVHALADLSYDNVRELSVQSQLNIIKSNVIYNQYWGLYFNLSESGDAIFKEEALRQAISAGINRSLIVDSLLGYGEEAKGPIPPISFAYNKQAKPYIYDKRKAQQLLDKAGWKYDTALGVRIKKGQKLTFDLALIGNSDRLKVADVIRQDLMDLGIEINIITKNLLELINQHIKPKQYDVVLFGVETFIDPDRFELFHSSQIEHPGLNIMGYSSSEKVSTVVNGKIKKVPEVDETLDDARKFVDENRRKQEYFIFQNIIADEVPVIFLYYPVEVYVVNKRVKNVDLSSINSLEDRFESIVNWEIKLD